MILLEPGHELRRLLACQWGAVAVCMGGGWMVGVQSWGITMPLLAFVTGTAAYVWRLAPERSLGDLDALKALALGSGSRSGAVIFVLAAANLPGPEAGGPDGLLVRGAMSLLLGGVALVTITGLTLVGLDAGRTGAVQPK